MIEHRKELREKVEHQQKQLTEALRSAEAAGHPADRITALNTELSVVASSISGGWETMTDVTAESLSRWLAATHNLVPVEKPAEKSHDHAAEKSPEAMKHTTDASTNGVMGKA